VDSTEQNITPDSSRWIAVRVAQPVGDLDLSAAFYRDLLGLPVTGGFTDHDGYSGLFFRLPGGGELELTAGPEEPLPGTGDDLLVLYVPGPEDVRRRAAVLDAAGVPTVVPSNPYWKRWGRTFLDPDGYAVVVAAAEATPAEVRIETYTGDRNRLRELFELAEDSPTELESYLDDGRVLVAVSGAETLGHLQMVDTGSPGRMELKNMAVREERQGLGIGRRLVQAALAAAGDAGGTELLVATAAADIGNLRFYQRLGFRMRSIERDAFTPVTGYPPGLSVDGIAVRDRVWLNRSLPHREQ
jgi:GNAT superfamily N-acetyltransferase